MERQDAAPDAALNPARRRGWGPRRHRGGDAMEGGAGIYRDGESLAAKIEHGLRRFLRVKRGDQCRVPPIVELRKPTGIDVYPEIDGGLDQSGFGAFMATHRILIRPVRGPTGRIGRCDEESGAA